MEKLLLSALWFLSFVFFYNGVLHLRPLYFTLKDTWGMSRKIRRFQEAAQKVYQLQEMLASGLVPEPHEWKSLNTLPAPWNEITHQSVMELRDQGAPVLPTLKRIRTSLEEQVELMQESQAKSAQAWSQALLGAILVPIFSFVLYSILPALENQFRIFLGITLFAEFFTLLALIWIGIMIDQARFGGVKKDFQSWYGNSLASMERLWAFISTGLPPDLAWRKMIEELSKSDQSLATIWGLTVWSEETSSAYRHNEFERLLVSLGLEIKKSIQVSLTEGRGSLERMEGIHRAFLTEYKLKLIRQLNLLPNQCLKPLFVFVFPAVFILLFTAIGLTVSESGMF